MIVIAEDLALLAMKNKMVCRIKLCMFTSFEQILGISVSMNLSINRHSSLIFHYRFRLFLWPFLSILLP